LKSLAIIRAGPGQFNTNLHELRLKLGFPGLTLKNRHAGRASRQIRLPERGADMAFWLSPDGNAIGNMTEGDTMNSWRA